MIEHIRACTVDGCDLPFEARGMCKKHYSAEYSKRRVRERRTVFFESQGGKCVQCGSTDRLEADHIDPSTKNGPIPWSGTEAKMLAELALCQVLCRTCHEAKTRGEQLAGHGRDARYKRGCRCEPCRTNYLRKVRDYKRKRRAEAKAARMAA